MCRYCEFKGRKTIPLLYRLKPYNVELELINNEKKGICIQVNYDEEPSSLLEIKYCPFCGIQIKREKNEHKKH